MSIVLQGSTSGSVTLQEPAIAGTTTINLPATTGTMALLQTPSFATTIGVGNATPSTSGAGITFPATQSASSDANTLDDYEEGTWTPVLTSAAGTLTTVVNGTGYYTKIGRQVTITCRPVITTNGTGSSALILAGLPFASSPSTHLGGGGREDAAAGNSFVYSALSSTSLYVTRYDNAYPGGNGYAFPFNFTYFV